MRIAALCLICLAALLAGCGQKGPLYLPDKGGTVVTSPAAPPAPAPTDSAPAPQTAPAQASPDKKKDNGDDSQPPQ